MSEDAGRPQVVIVPEQTSVTSGTDVQEKLITAARVFADLLKPTFGPRGLDKMLYKTDGNTAITNDGAKIVAELLVKHPAAKMMVAMANSQEENCGDGVTTTMLLCGSLLQEANTLLRKGLHPLTLVEGYRKSFKIACDQMENDMQKASSKRLLGVAQTSLTGKAAEGALDLFSELIAEALTILSKSRNIPRAEHVAMFKSNSAGLGDSRLIRGVAFRRRVLMDNFPNKLFDAKVAVISGDLKIRKMSRDAEIQINSADQLDAFVDAERDRKREIADLLIASGAKIILCGGEIDRDILHLLADSEILVIGELDSSEVNNSADATGANILDSVMDIQPSDVGICGSLIWERREASDMVEDIIRIDNCTNPRVLTIEVGGSGDLGTDEIIRGIHDGLRATSAALEENSVLPGAGAIHARIAQAIRNASESEPGRGRLAMDAFSRALETIPATLVENSGGEPLDRILELRSATNSNSAFQGITIDGDVGEVIGVWHPFSVIEESLQSATETAISMLRIDQVISARGD
jgi:chaperonin GroEL (HSP60 family)|tara:strand:- start:5719 stop:7290 length:1572 start_codon:yes stop_codon:yes gene_type:complete